MATIIKVLNQAADLSTSWTNVNNATTVRCVVLGNGHNAFVQVGDKDGTMQASIGIRTGDILIRKKPDEQIRLGPSSQAVSVTKVSVEG